MIKSELVQRISMANPHLYQRDVENIVNAILGEIVAAMASRTLELDPDARPMADYLLERHYRRKHGTGAYYGQGR